VIFTYNNLLSAGGAWITGGPGTVTVDPVTGQITMVTDGTGLVYARRAVQTEVNKTYQLTWSQDTSTLMFRQIGSGEGLADIRGANVSALGDNKIEFTAISTTTWISFQRTTIATVVISSISLQEVPAVATGARRLNGKNQYFSLDAQASGLRISNANFYIGGWMAFEYEPNIGIYIMDFGRTDPTSPAGGAGRVRMWWLPDQSRLAVSTCESAGTNYRENYIIKDLPVRTWHYVGLTALANADVLLRIGTQKGASYVGSAIPPVSATDICRVFQLGAKVFNPRNSFSPCRYSDWIWSSNWIPSDAQINELASGKRPSEVSGLTPPAGAAIYHWAMSTASGDEPSLISAGAPLVSNSTYGSITTVPGLIVETAQAVSAPPLDIIIT
jgi:hypothetical protein